MVCMQGRWIAGLLLSTAWSPAQAPPGGAVPKPGIGRWLLHEPPAGDAPKLTLRCVYPADQHTLADQSAYLSDLQRRFGELGLRVVVLLQGEVQKATAVDPAASYSLGTITGEAPAGARAIGPVALQQLLQQRDQWDAFGPAQLLTPANELLFAGLPSAGLAGAIRRGLAGKLDADAEFRNARIRADLLSGSMSNGGDFHVPIDALLAHEPTDGIAWALRYLDQLDNGHVAEARATAKAACQALAEEMMPLMAFVDLALRADRDPVVLREVAMALLPAAAAAPDSPLLQLVQLRALLRSGRDRDAGKLVQRLPKLLAGRPQELLAFAATLADAPAPQPWRDAAERAIATAAQLGADPRWLLASRYQVARHCAEDAAGAARLLAEYQKGPGAQNDLNNDAWYLMAHLDTMGRFDSFALAQCEELQRVEGANISAGNQDTVALALFRNGRIDAAIELQTTAAQRAGNMPTYAGRLERYRQTKALRADGKQDGGERRR